MKEIDRIREAYARRAEQQLDARYETRSPANRYLYEQRERDLLAMLERHALLPLAGKDILDIGAGNGQVLRDFARLGADPGRCSGVDLLPDRVEAARAQSREMRFACGDASALPYPDASFDIALQFTLLSSVLDEAMRTMIAAETLRVLRPGGAVIVYDFTWNPGNRDVRGVGAATLRGLYAGCTVDARRVTLAPPIARRLAPVSPRLCRPLELLPPLRSHVMAVVTKPL